MGKTVVLFPGQGAQKCGMGKDFYTQYEAAAGVFKEAEQILDFDIKALCFEENEQLHLTEYTQAAMVTTSLAILAVMKEQGFAPGAAAGLSLGEYCAVAAAGALSVSDAIALVRKRGIYMQNAVPAGKGAMAAVLGMTAEQTEAVLAGRENVQIANYNCPGQLVISGLKEAVTEAAEALKEAGAKRVLPLKVSGPFHSSLLKPAGEALAAELADKEVRTPAFPYVANVTADYVTKAEEIKPLFIRQVSSPVRFEQSIRRLIADGADTFIEVGPGKTLTGFIKKIDKNCTAFGIENVEEYKSFLEWWNEQKALQK